MFFVSCFNFFLLFVFYLYQVADQAFWIHFSASYFLYSNFLIVWSIIFYICQLFVFLSFFYCYFFFIIYLFTTAIYCQVISVYQLINNYWFICFIITLKVYLVYSIIYSIIFVFYYCWLSYVSPQFLFCCYYFKYISEVLTFPIDTTNLAT